MTVSSATRKTIGSSCSDSEVSASSGGSWDLQRRILQKHTSCVAHVAVLALTIQNARDSFKRLNSLPQSLGSCCGDLLST